MTLERTTVHISDDTGRIAMLEVRTVGSDAAPASLQRYIYSNHLQSTSLELDENADIISYEEYHPFGTTAYSASNTAINAIAKRYRYTGKERDEETGLYYHGARYYIPWLARWSASDPINSETYNIFQKKPDRSKKRKTTELAASPYEYCYDNPVRFTDPTGEQPPANEDTAVLVGTKPAEKAIPEPGEQKGVWYHGKKGMAFAPGVMNKEDFEKSEYAKKGDYFGAAGGMGGAEKAVNYRQDGSMIESYGSGKPDVYVPYKESAPKVEVTKPKGNGATAGNYSTGGSSADSQTAQTAETVKQTSEIYTSTTYLPGLANDIASSSKVQRLLNLRNIPTNYSGLSRVQQIQTVRRIFETTERLSKPITRIGLGLTGIGAGFSIANAAFEAHLTGTLQRSTRVDLAITLTFTVFAFIPATAPFFWGANAIYGGARLLWGNKIDSFINKPTFLKGSF